MSKKLNSSNASASYGQMEHWLLTTTLLLRGFGLLMVLSASGIMAERV